MEIKKYSKLPKGWIYTNMHGINTAPNGYVWASNNKSRFGTERKSGLVKIKK